MIKRGHVYKVYYDGRFITRFKRNYIIFCPQYDITIFNQFKRYGHDSDNIFQITLTGTIGIYRSCGMGDAIGLTKPNTKTDFEEIEKAIRKFNFETGSEITYNKELNKIEGYESE